MLFFFTVEMTFKFYPLKPRGLILCPERQSMQSALKSVEKTGPPKSPIGFLGRRKHNGAVSFSARKTISGVCADDAVAENFSAVKFS